MKPNICFMCLKTFPKRSKGTVSDLHSKFWNLAESYLGVKTDNGGNSVEDSFCEDCGRLVQDVCQLYSELAAVQLRLSYKVGEMGELLESSKGTVSDKLGQLLIRRLAEQMGFDTRVHLDQLRNLLMKKCLLKRKISMPEVQVQQMKISKRTPGLSLPASSHPARQSDFQVEYIFVEREEESFPVDTHDDYDNDFPSSDPLPSPQPSNTEEALPKSFQKALDLLPTKNYHGRDLKPKKKYKKKLPDVEEPLQKRRKTVVNKSYAEVDEFKDLPPPRSWIAYIKKKKKSSEDEEDEYVPPEKTEPPSTKFKEKVKTRKITFFSCLLTKVEDSSSEETFKCSKCDAILPNRWDMLRAHVVKEHTDRLVCSECGEKFGRLAYLKAHLKKKHENAAQPVLKTPCHVCGRPCDATYMKTHRWTHYSEEERDAALARGEKLPYRKNKKFQCDQCEKRFYSMDILKAHTKKVHEGIPLPPAKRKLCPDCGADVRNLAQHIRQKHSDYGKRKFACITCDKRFVSQNDLRQHKFQAHGNEKPYQCEVCGRGFKTRQNMEQHHTNVHVNAKVYQCPHCPMKFTNKRVWFERHIVAKHGGGDGTISQPNQRVEYEQEEQKLNVEQLQAVNLCQQDFGGGVVPMSNLHPFY